MIEVYHAKNLYSVQSILAVSELSLFNLILAESFFKLISTNIVPSVLGVKISRVVVELSTVVLLANSEIFTGKSSSFTCEIVEYLGVSDFSDMLFYIAILSVNFSCIN